MSRHDIRRVVLPLAVLIVWDCTSDGGRAGWQGSMRDSAGVVLVENPALVPAAVPACSLEVDLTIGELDGETEYTFGRITDVTIDRQGRFFVLDQLAQEVKVYDPDGMFLMTVGGPGEGPGELGDEPTSVMISDADTIYVADYWQRRINVYSPEGAPAETIRLPGEPGALSWNLVEERHFVFRGYTVSHDASGRFQIWDGLLRFQAARDTPDTLLSFDYEAPDFGTVGELRQPLIVNTAFWDRMSDGRLVWSALDRDRVLIHDADGRLERIVLHDDWRPRPASDEDRTAVADVYLERRRMTDRNASLSPNVVVPDMLPGITVVKAAPDGTVWVQRMGDAAIHPSVLTVAIGSGRLGGPAWDVVDLDGRVVGQCHLPDRFRLVRLVEGAAVGVWRDELDVERVMRLRIVD